MKTKILNILNSAGTNETKVELILSLFRIRTSAQNRALHLYFTFVANELNNLGLEFTYKGIKRMEISVPYNAEIVKNYIWRPIQIALFKEKSTTKLTTKQINQIEQIIGKFFAEKGVFVEFPSIENLQKSI